MKNVILFSCIVFSTAASNAETEFERNKRILEDYSIIRVWDEGEPHPRLAVFDPFKGKIQLLEGDLEDSDAVNILIDRERNEVAFTIDGNTRKLKIKDKKTRARTDSHESLRRSVPLDSETAAMEQAQSALMQSAARALEARKQERKSSGK